MPSKRKKTESKQTKSKTETSKRAKKASREKQAMAQKKTVKKQQSRKKKNIFESKSGPQEQNLRTPRAKIGVFTGQRRCSFLPVIGTTHRRFPNLLARREKGLLSLDND